MDCRLCSWLNLSRPDGWVKPDSYMRGQIQPYPCCALLFLIPPSISAHSLLPAVEILGLKDDANELPIHAGLESIMGFWSLRNTSVRSCWSLFIADHHH